MYQVLPSWSGNFGLGCMGVFVRVARSSQIFAVTFEPKVQITQNKNLVRAIVNIYNIIVNSNQTFMPVLRKKSLKLVRFYSH